MIDNQFDNFVNGKLKDHSAPVPAGLWDKVADGQFDNFISNKLTNHQAPVPSDLWDKITDTRFDSFVSDKLISLLMSQISENKSLMRVFEDLFNATGSEIYLKPMHDYIKAGEQVDFYTVLESAKRKGQTAIGYRVAALAHDHDKAYGVVINPTKSKLLSFTAQDKIIVLAME